jgi:uncharacterized protein (AIM24 family)
VTGLLNEDPFTEHLRRAGEFVGARRLPDAEVEVLRALAEAPDDVRGLKLLALIRFKLGRLGEARDTYQAVASAIPNDAGVRLNLGLIAIKLESLPEAVSELEAAGRLDPENPRVWSYLGYAYSRLGRDADAEAAFRRGGQPELAGDLSSGQPGLGAVEAGLGQSDGASLAPAWGATASIEPSSAGWAAAVREPVSLTAFAVARLLPEDSALGIHEWVAKGVQRWRVQPGAHVRRRAILAATEDIALSAARKRSRGLTVAELLGPPGDAFYRCAGFGDVWLSLGVGTPVRLTTLTLEDDIFFFREDRVVAFDGDVVWESGRPPLSNLALLQFRASGSVIVDLCPDHVSAIRLTEGKALVVDEDRLLGWVGRVIVHGVKGDESDAPSRSATPHLACEGEGVVLLSTDVQPAQSVQERTKPGDHGAHPPDPGGVVLHR